MKPVEEILVASGYKVQNISYPSTEYSIAEISRNHVAPKISTESCDKIHFIGHSMGGIVARHYLSENHPDNLGNVILITTPNGGSDLVSEVEESDALGWTLVGPAVKELGVGSELLKNLPKPYYKTGIVTASKSINPFTSLFLLDGPNDGTLTVESMKLKDMHDTVNIPSSHTLVLTHPDLKGHIESFLRNGQFIH